MTRFAVAGYLCFDLGGSVRKADPLIDALQAAGWPAERWEAGEDALQLSYKVSHVPTVIVEDEQPVELQLPAPARPTAKRTIKIFPAGVISFHYMVDCGACRPSGLYAIKQCFSASNKGGITRYLEQAYDLPTTTRERDEDYGIRVIDDLLRIRETVQTKEILAFRPGIHFPILARYALCVAPRPGERALAAQLDDLARAKGVGPPRVSSLPTATLASWEGFETYIATDGDADLQRTLHAFELTHQFSFLCRAWTEILDRYVALHADVGEELPVLRQRLTRLAYHEHQITESMIEIDSGDVMLLDPVQLELTLEFRERFFLERAKKMVVERLGVLDRQATVIGGAIDRARQDRYNRDALTLQLLFAGAVAASIAALVPPSAHFESSTGWNVVTWALVGVLWLLIVAVAILVVRRREQTPTLQPVTKPEWLERQPKPGTPAPPDRTPPEHPDTGHGPPPG
jgi:hypothetical protein